MTLTLTTTQVQERLTITLACASAASLPAVIIVVDGKAYTGLWTPSTGYAFTYDIALERGPHIIYAQATDSGGTVTTASLTYVMAYELTSYGIDIYGGDAKLDVFGVTLHDELLPALPTLNFSCAILLTGTIGAVIRERGLKQYQFTIATVAVSGGIYTYTCKAAESYALTTAIMALQTAYGATSDAIALIAPSLNIVNASLLAQTTYPQLFNNITPLEVIKQLMIQALAQASVRNGNLYVFPLDASAWSWVPTSGGLYVKRLTYGVPDYHMQRLDPLTVWQRDSDIYDTVQAHYIVKQYPNPDTVLTLNDAANWTGTTTNVTQVATTLLPVPSGALGMLKSVGNASRAGLNALFKNFDRIQFNWNPVTATTVLVSLQQDAGNKLELTHTFAGQTGAGFLLAGSPGVSTDTLTKNITLSPVQYVTTVTGTTTAGCSYRVTLLDAGGATIWQDSWRSTIGNMFEADVPTFVSQVYQATTVRIEVKDTYLIGSNYGVQCITCHITVQTLVATPPYASVVSSTVYPSTYIWWSSDGYYRADVIWLPSLPAGQWYEESFSQVTGYPPYASPTSDGQGNVGFIPTSGNGDMSYFGDSFAGDVTLMVKETISGYSTWVSAPFVWSAAFNLFESLDLSLADFTRTGNPANLATIALTFTGDNYVDTLVLVADNPLPVTVRAGTGSRAYAVTDDFGSQAGAQAYADGLLPIVSVAREQYTRDVPLSVDLSVGDTVNGDGTNYTIYAVDYRQDGKTLAAGKSMDTLQTRLAEQARRLGTLERKV